MLILLILFWVSICFSEAIDYSISENDGDKYMLFVASFCNFCFLLFLDELAIAFFVLAFVNLVLTLPFYIVQKLDVIYPILKIITYVGVVVWIVKFV
jgi:hypothetical protein